MCPHSSQSGWVPLHVWWQAQRAPYGGVSARDTAFLRKPSTGSPLGLTRLPPKEPYGQGKDSHRPCFYFTQAETDLQKLITAKKETSRLF